MNAIRLVMPALFLGFVGSTAWADEKPDFAKLILGTWDNQIPPDKNYSAVFMEFDSKGKAKSILIFKDKKLGQVDLPEATYKIEGNKLVWGGAMAMQGATWSIKKLNETELVFEDRGKVHTWKRKPLPPPMKK